MVKIHLDIIYLECRRLQLIQDIRRLAEIGKRGNARACMLRIRRRQRSLNLINKRIAKFNLLTHSRKESP